MLATSCNRILLMTRGYTIRMLTWAGIICQALPALPFLSFFSTTDFTEYFKCTVEPSIIGTFPVGQGNSLLRTLWCLNAPLLLTLSPHSVNSVPRTRVKHKQILSVGT